MEIPFSSRERAVGALREVTFEATVAGERVPGLLFVPPGEGPWPLVLVQHPATSSKDDYFVRDVALQWAGAHGWACCGLDAPLHGERDEHDPMSVLRDRSRFTALASQFAGEVDAVVDALAARYPLDTTRMGFVGYSLGSMLGIPAVAASGRFKAAAFCLVGDGGMLGSAADEDSPVRRLGKVAVRIVAKLSDEFFSKESTESLYAALPGEKDVVWLPGGHFEIGPDVIRAAEAWLRERL